ncbi:hypothetical protein KD4_30400 [Yersinia pseudotuberculosis]
MLFITTLGAVTLESLITEATPASVDGTSFQVVTSQSSPKRLISSKYVER